jgi:hypothetical protein
VTSPPPARFAITRRGDGFDIIYGWRNSSFHGSASLPTVGGAVLLVAMSELQNAYEGTRAEAIRRIGFELPGRSLGSYRRPWSYYPPYA